jgi:uncharacterized protein with von Willebrand factor type A (vWA) domain
MTIDRIGPLRKILSSGNEMKIKNTGKRSKSDRVELSHEAKKMAELSQIETKIKSASDIRKELTPQRIKELRDKLEDPDQYLTKEVAEKIAEKVAESFGIK